MIPDIFNQVAAESKQLDLWIPILGVIIVFLGMNLRVEIKILEKEELED